MRQKVPETYEEKLAQLEELRFQAIGFRWADNLRKYDAPEPRRFVTYDDAMSAAGSEILARASATTP